MRGERILIAGAGMGGLTLALALLQRGFEVSVFERAPELSEIGAGVQCSPNGAKCLASLGLTGALEKVQVVLRDRDVRHWKTGETWSFANHGAGAAERYGGPFVVLHRADLHRILVEAVRAISPGAVHVNAQVVDVAQDENGATLKLADGSVHTGAVVVGADGIHSTVRRKLFGQEVPQFFGEVAWRGLVPMGDLPPHLRKSVSANWIGPKGSVVTYPVRNGELLNFVGLIARSDWRVESWVEQGSMEDCRNDFRAWHPDVLTIIEKIKTHYIFALFVREPMRAWSRGRITLLGDACHPTTPYLGQGMNMALEDAIVLARCLSDIDTPEEALRRYEASRAQRTEGIVKQSAKMAGLFHDPILGDEGLARDYIEKNWSRDSIREHYDWIYDYDAKSVAIA